MKLFKTGGKNGKESRYSGWWFFGQSFWIGGMAVAPSISMDMALPAAGEPQDPGAKEASTLKSTAQNLTVEGYKIPLT